MKSTFLYFSAAIFGLFLSTASAQGLVIPQIADGGGWQTTIVVTNTSASAAPASLVFFQETGGGNTAGWNAPLLETSTPLMLSLPAAGTLFLHTSGTAAATTVGWAELQANTFINAYAIFTQRVPGRTDQDGTATAAASSSRVLIPYDNTNGFVTAVALANTTGASETITVGIQPTSGSSSQPASITLPANGHTSFATSQQFPTTAGQSGLLELSATNGSLSALALRFNPTGGFTTAPAYQATGTPIIGGGSSAGGLPFPQFNILQIINPTVITSSLPNLTIAQVSLAAGACLIQSGQTVPPISIVNAIASWSSYSTTGLTVTCNNLAVIDSIMQTQTGSKVQITSGSLTLTLNPQVVSTSGTVTGSFSMTSTIATVSGTFSGTYTAQ